VKLTTHLHLLPRSKNAWRYTSTPQYAFMAWCLVKHMDFTLPETLSLGVKRPGRESEHSPPSSAEFKECVEVFTAVNIQVEVFWIMTLCSVGGRIPTFRRTLLPPSCSETLVSYHNTEDLDLSYELCYLNKGCVI
jgi:hypothetical protein